MKEIFLPFTKKEWILRMILVGVLFIGVAVPFRYLLALVPGVTEVRPANTIPVVFGMIWGPAGAWGIAIANAVSDILTGAGLSLWLPGLIINFFYAWLPYKLWYSFDFGGQGVEAPRLGSVRAVLKYILVVALSSLVTTTLLALLFELLGFQNYGASGLLLFFNNFDFAVVLGVPLILLLTSRQDTVFWIPVEYQRDKVPMEGTGEYNRHEKLRKMLGDSMLLLISAAGIVYYILSLFRGLRLPSRWELFLLVLFLCFEVLYVFRPFASYQDMVSRMDIRTLSIRAKVVLGFLLLTVFSVLLVGITSYNARMSEMLDPWERWEAVYTAVGLAANILFLVTLVFLLDVEKNITGPIELLKKQVEEFAGRDHYADAKSALDLKKNRMPVSTGDEIEALFVSFGKMMDDITDYVGNLVTVTAEKERIGAELNVAAQIQADMLPRIFPPYPERSDFDLYATMDPAKEVGGDFYDFFLVDDDHLAMVMADVSGKGVPASLFMVIAKTLIKNRTQMGGSPAEILNDVNEQLCQGNDAELFVTVWLGILELSTGKGVAANAGHEHPVLRRNGGDFELVVYRHSPAVAVMEGIRFREHGFELYPGDILYVYTDGVAEATDEKNTLYGTGRMLDTLNRHKDAEMKDLLFAVKEDIEAFTGEAPQFDDITMLGLVYYGNQENSRG